MPTVGKRLRRLPKFIAFALPVIAVGMWGLSYLHTSIISHPRGDDETWFIVSWHGRIELASQRFKWHVPNMTVRADTTKYGENRYSSDSGNSGSSRSDMHPTPSNGFLGFGSRHSAGGAIASIALYTHYVDQYFIPYWSIAAIACIPAIIILLYRRRLRRRIKRGQCPNCGYDLRATPDRCPECGMAATSRAAATIG